MPKKKATPLAQQVATKKRPVEWIAERLTGNRAQAGRLPGGGAPRYSYEVKWKNTGETAETAWPNTFEVADNLGGWEKEMKEVDERIAARANEPSINPVQQATAARELAAQRKGEKLAAHRERLLRKKRREEARGGSDSSPPDSEAEHDDELPDGEQLEAELSRLQTELRQLQGRRAEQDMSGDAEDAEQEEVSAGPATEHKRTGRSRVWKAFDRTTQTCTLPHPKDRGRICGAPPGKGTGTSGHRQHLTAEHAEEWTHILKTGERKTSVQMIEEALKAKVDLTKPALGDKERDELHRLVGLWVAKCGRPPTITEDAELKTLLARILELCKSRFRYELPCRQTVGVQLTLLGVEGKALARDFVVRLLQSGVKVSISGDLWSSNGMGLFGIYAHGITETWVMEKALIGLVACDDKVYPTIPPPRRRSRHRPRRTVVCS
jgi:hypothetical protein